MVSWCDLPSDILRCVAARLDLVDQIRFRAVCKDWHQITEVKTKDKLTWIFVLNERGRKGPHYYLYDVRNRKSYGVLIHRKSTRVSLGRLESCCILCIKLGWLLVNPRGDRLVLFNPFSQEIIHLPELRTAFIYLFTLRYCPKSRRFVVYSAYTDDQQRIVINKWKSGDRGWESSNFAAEFPRFMKTIIKIEVVGETLYCIFKAGVVGSFNGSHNSWSVVIKHSEEDKFDIYRRMFEFRGELLMMDIRHSKRWVLWRLDQSKGCWVEVVEYHKFAIICSNLSSFSELCSEHFIVDSEPVATRIYYFRHVCMVSEEHNRGLRIQIPRDHSSCQPH